MTAKTRADLVGEVARRFGMYRRSTATGGSTTTLADTAKLYEPNDYWIGHHLYIVTDAGGLHAAPEAEERPVTDFVQSTATLTVGPAFTAAPVSGDTYELLPAKREDVIAAVNAGIRAAGETWLTQVVDTTTVTLADDDYEYNLPAGLVRVLAVWVRDASDEAWRQVPGRNWHVAGTAGAPQVLYFDSLDGVDSGQDLRLDYLARLSELSADSSSLGIGEPAEREAVEFVTSWALYWLHDMAASRAPESAGYRAHLTQAQYYVEIAERFRTRAARWQPAGTVHGARWAKARG